MMRALGRRAQHAKSEPAPGGVARASGAPPGSAHRFADVAVDRGDELAVAQRGPLPLRFGIGRTEPFDVPADGAITERPGDIVGWDLNPPLDLLELRATGGAVRVTAVKAIDLGLEAYRSAAGIERELTPLVDRFAEPLRFEPAKRALHLELSGEPSADQLEGLARLRDHTLRRAKETGVELDLHVAAPAGRPVLRPPKP
jgi:hypothetical protein